MAAEKPVILPESFIHPRQDYLWQLLQSGDFPEGADVLIKEAIEEYQLAFGTPKAVIDRLPPVRTSMAVSLPEDGPGTILAAKSHVLTVQFGNPIEEAPKPAIHLGVMLRLSNMPDTKIYPHWLRFIAVNENGDSKPASFLLQVPNQLRGYNGRIEVNAINGSTLRARLTHEVSIR